MAPRLVAHCMNGGQHRDASADVRGAVVKRLKNWASGVSSCRATAVEREKGDALYV